MNMHSRRLRICFSYVHDATETSMTRLPFLLVLLLFNCGGKKSSKKMESLTLPTNGASESESRAPANYPYECRPVDEVQGGNYDFFWAYPRPGEIEELKLHPEKKFLQIKYLGTGKEYTSPVTKVENSFDSGDYRATIPMLPTGTIRGRKKEYTIVELYLGENEIETFLCPMNLKDQVIP